MKKFAFALIATAGALLAQFNDALTDQKVFQLVSTGLDQNEIIRLINNASEVNFDLSPAATDALMKAGVSGEIIRAMAARANGTPQVQPLKMAADHPKLSAALPAVQSNAPPVPEVGAYYFANDKWVEMMPEVVNWRIGGVVKSVATVGIVKPDRNGHLRNGRSKTPLHTPVQLLVYTPEGTQITEYQLIRMHTHAHAREFRILTGAIFHPHGDSDRDDIPFDSQHIGVRTWTISLTGLRRGEYGLLPSGLAESQSASAQLGKMYTFTVIE